uniref:Uncharacterized protein n=1 Tax=Arundo donax TaxID=35708 RepID=A0A0A8ZAX5_ARUDO
MLARCLTKHPMKLWFRNHHQ